ncbi:MAG: lipopolysaccharide biosynthesis protein [Chitinispirillaceae bacterium]
MNQRRIGAVLSYTLLGVKNGVFLFFVPVVVNWLGKEQYGLYSIVGSFMASLLILDMGLSNSVVRFVAKFRALQDTQKEYAFLSTILGTYLFFALIASVIGIVLYFHLPRIFSNSLSTDQIAQLQVMFVFLIINVCLTLAFNPFRGVLAAYERFIVLKGVEIFQQLLRVALILLLLMGYESVVCIVVADTVCRILAIVVRVAYTRKLGIHIRLAAVDWNIIKEVFSYSFFITINLIAYEIYWKTDNIILGIMTNASLVAVYSLGAQISSYYSHFSWSLSQVFTSKIVSLVETGASGQRLTDELIKTGRIQLMIISTVFLCFVFFGRSFIHLWVGTEFDESFTIALVIMIPMTVLLVQNIGITILEAKRKHHFRSVTMLVMSVINIFSTMVLVKIMGIIGAAVSTAAGLILGNILMLNFYYHRVIRLDMIRYYAAVGKGILIAVCVVVTYGTVLETLFAREPSWVSLLLRIFSFCVVYGVSLWLVGANSSERKLLTDFFGFRIRRVKKTAADSDSEKKEDGDRKEACADRRRVQNETISDCDDACQK